MIQRHDKTVIVTLLNIIITGFHKPDNILLIIIINIYMCFIILLKASKNK